MYIYLHRVATYISTEELLLHYQEVLLLHHQEVLMLYHGEDIPIWQSYHQMKN